MKTRAELDAMSAPELKEYEQSLLAQWTPEIALENQIDRLSIELSAQLEIFSKLKYPDDAKNLRLKNSVQALNRKIAELKDQLANLSSCKT